MKKSFLALALSTAFLFGCGGSDEPTAPTPQAPANTAENPAPPAANDDEVGNIARGTWNGNVYTNPQLGFTITTSGSWEGLTDQDIAELTGMVADVSLDGFSDDIWDDLDMDEFTEAMIMNFSTGSNIIVMFERTNIFTRRLSASEFVNQMGEEFAAMGFQNVEVASGTTRIGQRDWNSVSSRTDFGDGEVEQHFFAIVEQGHIVTVIVSVFGDDTIEGILQMFA